jgi:hypothetical protein
MSLHPYSIAKKTDIIAIQMGLRYGKINPIRFTIPYSIVWNIQTSTIVKDMCNIIPLYTRVIPTMLVSNSFHENTIINIILDTMVSVKGRRLIGNCCRKSLTRNCSRKLVLEITNKNLLSETTIGNYY